jgi:hypothetical protein
MEESRSLWMKALAEYNELRKRAGKTALVPKRGTEHYWEVIRLMKEIANREIKGPPAKKPCLIIE